VAPTRVFAGVVIVCAAGVLGWVLLRSGPPRSAPPAEVPVTEAVAASQDVPVYVEGLGTVQAFNTVAVRSRVSGQITSVAFREGQEVKTGDPLFQIDPRPFQAALEQAQATKSKDEAQLHGAELDLERYAKLLAPGFQSRQSYDQQTATVGQLRSAVQADQAMIDNAQLNLDYALIRSPIDGRTGQRLVDLGNFVQAAQNTNLVIIAQLKPVFVSFTVAQENLDSIRDNQAKHQLTVEAYSSDDKRLLSQGQVTLIDNQIDVATGTIHLRATFANADERLWPGEFVNAHLVLTMLNNAVTVPSQTVMEGPEGSYAYVVGAQGKAERRAVEVGLVQNGMTVINKGVASGEQVVVDGQYRLTNGSKVKTNTQQAALGPQ
jgi:membrane fusion protein, multidrug efflux system